MSNGSDLLARFAALDTATVSACRDVGQARELGLPVFARAPVPVTARGRLRQKSAGEPVVVGEGRCICAASGDLDTTNLKRR